MCHAIAPDRPIKLEMYAGYIARYGEGRGPGRQYVCSPMPPRHVTVPVNDSTNAAPLGAVSGVA